MLLLFLSTFFYFLTYLFPGLISIRIDNLEAQLLLQLFTDHFETMHTFSTWSEDVRVVLSYSTILFLNFFSTFST